MISEETVGPIERQVRINARPEEVFQFLTDPAKLVRWLGLKAEIDPRPGGIFRLDVNGVDVIRGQYVEVVPNRKVVFTWGWEGAGDRVPPGSTTVEITLEPEGDATLLCLRHFDLPEPDREKHAMGWGHYLERLRIVGEGRDPGPDPLARPDIRHG